MGMQSDVWSATWFNNTAALKASGSIAGTGAITLLTTAVGFNGVGAKVTVTSSGDEDDTEFTVVGIGMDNQQITEVITGVDTNTVSSTNYYTSIVSISNDTASVGNISIGLSGLALPKCRIRGLYYTGAASAGSVIITRYSDSRKVLNVVSPASSGANAFNVWVPGEGIVSTYTLNDYATVALTQVGSATILCS
jgi:hypothetical protein